MIGTHNEPYGGYGWKQSPFGHKVYTAPGSSIFMDAPPAPEGWVYFFIARHGSYTNFCYKPVSS
jgi:hypothetical protein